MVFLGRVVGVEMAKNRTVLEVNDTTGNVQILFQKMNSDEIAAPLRDLILEYDGS